MIFIKKPPVIRFRKRAWLRRKLRLIEKCPKNAKRRSELIDEIAKTPPEVTTRLAAQLDYKCWYCERKLPRSELVVEHFRPKKLVTSIPAHPGYFWLAANTKNFRISCKNCNCRWTNPNGVVAGKGNYFPLLNESKRIASRHLNILQEEPLLFDPLVQADCEGLLFMFDGECIPASSDHIEVNRAFSSITLYNLNNPVLVNSRKFLWSDIELLAKTASALKSSDPILFKITIDKIREKARDNAEFAGLVRSAIFQLNSKFSNLKI